MGSTENRTKTRDKDRRGGRAIAVEDARVTEHHDSPPTAVGWIDLIDAPQHVRELDPEHVRSLAGSIALQGVVVPIVVRAAASATSWSPVRGLDRVRLHADVTILAKPTIALARGRARAVPLAA
jgi:hypothetical protein